MAKSNDPSLNFIEEIHVAAYWRKQLGEYEYVKRDPDDLFRWYQALETRGPEDIRSYLRERSSYHPATTITGIVASAPHPPREIIEVWLASHSKFDKGPVWYGLAAFMVATFMISTNLTGCQNLHSLNQIANMMPQPATLVTATVPGSPTPMATMPSSGPPAPVFTAPPTAGREAPPNPAQ